MPNLYIVRKQAEVVHRYFLYYFPDGNRYDISVRSRIQKLIAYKETEAYSVTGNDFPIILAVCDTASIERLVQRTFRNLDDELTVYTTSSGALKQLSNEDQLIWSNITDQDELMSFLEVL